MTYAHEYGTKTYLSETSIQKGQTPQNHSALVFALLERKQHKGRLNLNNVSNPEHQRLDAFVSKQMISKILSQ